MFKELYRFNSNLMEMGVFLNFSGPITQEIIVELGELVKKKLEFHGKNKTEINRAFSLFIEQSQNIVHYSAEQTVKNGSDALDKIQSGMIVVGIKAGHIFVIGGNLIKNKSIGPLKQRLMQVASMSKNELRIFYKEQRTSESNFEKSKGAGLGIIEVARKSNTPLEFKFEKVDDQFSFFLIKSEV